MGKINLGERLGPWASCFLKLLLYKWYFIKTNVGNRTGSAGKVSGYKYQASHLLGSNPTVLSYYGFYSLTSESCQLLAAGPPW